MSTFALDPVYNDFAFTKGRMSLVTGAAETAQKLNARFGFGLGSWFLDTQLGVPWVQAVLVANPNVLALTFMVQQIILGTPGVKSIVSLSAKFDKATRTLEWGAQIQHDSGAVIAGGRGQPFIVHTQRVAA